MQAYNSYKHLNKGCLQGRVKFPIGGIVRERIAQDLALVQVRIWCDSKTDSIVWMKEDMLG